MVKEIQYDSFGYILSDTNPDLAVPFGFAGGLHDRDTGLVRFGHRDYDPDTGRWTAKDPILFDGGDTDLYGYCVNDPVNLVDPEGLMKVGPVWGGAGMGENPGTNGPDPVGEYFADPKNKAKLLSAGFAGGKAAAEGVKATKSPWGALIGIPFAVGSYFGVDWLQKKGLDIINEGIEKSKKNNNKNPCK